MDNGRKLVEEELEMPGGDTKQWLSKLLEAPIMQATLQQAFQKLFRNNLLSLKKKSHEKYFPPLCSISHGFLAPSPSRNRSMMGWMSMEMGERITFWLLTLDHLF